MGGEKVVEFRVPAEKSTDLEPIPKRRDLDPIGVDGWRPALQRHRLDAPKALRRGGLGFSGSPALVALDRIPVEFLLLRRERKGVQAAQELLDVLAAPDDGGG